MSHGPAAAPGRDDRDLFAVRGMAGERRVDRAGGPRRGSPNEGPIFADERQGFPVIGEKLGQSLVRRIRLRDDQNPRSVLVETVHDAGPPHAADPGEARAAMGDQRIDERPCFMAGGRMHHEPGRFVDDEQMLVLEDDLERNGLAQGGGIGGLRQAQACGLPGAKQQARVFHVAPSMAAWPASIRLFTRVRDIFCPEAAAARKRSSLSPLCWGPARQEMLRFIRLRSGRSRISRHGADTPKSRLGASFTGEKTT